MLHLQMKMLKQIENDVDDTMIVATGNNVKKSLEKHFNYEMSDKKAKSNLIKGASREAIETEEMQKCTMINLSVGAYHEVVISSFGDWKIGTKIINTEIKNIIPGYDENQKHMQTIVKILFNKNMITVTFFNSTQRIKVEGRGYLDFVKNVLTPLIMNKLDKDTLENIEKYNRDVIAALSGKRKAISRPTRSVKYKAMAKLPCSKCDDTFSNSTTLMKHKRIMHTKGVDDSRSSINNIPIVDDLSLLELSEDEDNEKPMKALTLVEACPVDIQSEKSPISKPVFKCENCGYSSLKKTDLETHKLSKHIQNDVKIPESYNAQEACSVESIEELTCRNCNYEAEDPETLKEHFESKHILENRNVSSCQKSVFETRGDKDINTHLQVEHKSPRVDIKKIKDMEIIIQCDQCEYRCRFNKQLKSHIKSKHVNPVVTCPFCSLELKTQDELKLHLEQQHGMKEAKPSNASISINTQEPFPCTQCGFLLPTFDLLQKHVAKYHTLNCRYCDFKGKSNDDLECHMTEDHEEVIILHSMSKQVDNLMHESVKQDSFKKDLSQILQSLFDNQEKMDKKMSLILRNIGKSDEIQQASTAAPTPTISPPQTVPSSPPTTCPPSPSTRPPVEKILLVGDSISNQLHIETVEYATKAKVRTAKAYSTINDNTNDALKNAPKFPTKNFNDVIENELEKEEADILLIQSGSVDISNLKTEGKKAQHTEYFKEQATTSATNLFSSATNAAVNHPGLKKIIIFKQTPRFDITTTTKPGLKQNLSNLFNDTLDELAANSDFKDKIVIGNHDLDCSGGVLLARYKDNRTGKFDGVHMYGPSGQKAYTNSVMKILSSAQLVLSIPPKYYEEYDHKHCAQTRYQARQRQNTKQGMNMSNNVYQYTVPTRNRFTQLGDYFPGNF